MKSGVQMMNFLERRACADRALSRLVGMVRETTDTLSSREQRGVYRLESTWAEKASASLPAAPVGIASAFAARWRAFLTIVLALVGALWTRVRVSYRAPHPRTREVFSRVRIVRLWLRRMATRAHCHWLLWASRRKVR